MAMTLAERMGKFAVGVRFEDLPPPVIHEVKRRVIDSLGCAFGAWHAEPCAIARRVVSALSAERGATLIGTKHRAPADWAAFANGCLVRYLDYNDTYLSREPAHPSDNIPAAMAVAESVGATGRELIAAIALAYEVQCRLCDAACIRSRGWDHVTYGAFSTALAAARLMRLDLNRARHAVGIAGVASANLRQSRVGELSHWKGCAFANAARHGVFAAMLAREGMTGPAPIFEGVNGFERLISGPLDIGGPFGADAPSASKLDWMILKTSIKYWPAEYHAQSAIDAALSLRKEIGDVRQIDSILIESHDAAVDIIGSEPEKWRPCSRETADHSLPYLVGVALADGEVTSRQFEPQRLCDPSLIELVSRIKVERHGELCAIYPAAVGNILNLRLTDGRTVSRRVDYPPGNAKNPLTDEQVEQKFHAQADEVLGRAAADRLVQMIWRLDELPTMGDLLESLTVE